MPNDDFRLISENSYGGGTPDAPVWFIGIEDAGPGLSSADVEKWLESCRKGNHYAPLSPTQILAETSGGTDIYRFIVYLLSGGTTQKVNDDTVRHFFKKDETNTCFQMNVRPLPRKKQSEWPSQYNDLFGFPATRRRMYDRAIRQTNRFKNLGAFWAAHKPRVTVCFGRTVWPLHKEILELEKIGENLEFGIERYVRHIDNVHCDIFLTHFFGRWSPSNLKCVLPYLARK